MDEKEKFVRVGGNLTDEYNDWVNFALDEACAISLEASMCHDSTYSVVLADILKRFKGTVKKDFPNVNIEK